MKVLLATFSNLSGYTTLRRSWSLQYTFLRLFSISPASRSAKETTTLQTVKHKVRWFYALDVPISKPEWYKYEKVKEPESFIPFSEYDSKQLEREFSKTERNLVEVNEDKLFQDDLKNFELSPIYWDGPIYEVRRGLWFNSDGMPLKAELTKEIEEGFQRLKPYTYESANEEQIKTTKSNKEKISTFNKLKQDTQTEIKIDLDKQKDVIRLSNGELVLYFNKDQAVMFPGDYDSEFQIDVIRYFGPKPVSLLGVNHIQRGYSEELKESFFDKLSKNPLPGISDAFKEDFGSIIGGKKDSNKTNEDEMSDVNELDDINMQKYLESDYDLETSKSKSNREIDHLVFCIHGIGQVLGTKYESVNFTHSINVLRNTMKGVFEQNEEYQKLANSNSEEHDNTNNRIQVLPISWRHRIGFNPQQEFNAQLPSRLPTLSQINVEGIRALRDVVGDVVLDVLLFYQPRYLKEIMSTVTSELNRVYKLYLEKNPDFKGKVHILGHSLGSAIAFDILSKQSSSLDGPLKIDKDLAFDVNSLFLVGSPVGMFKLLEEKNIVGRDSKSFVPSQDDTFASPKCVNLYNIFHPCDPVAYRIEPLASPSFGNYKPVDIQFAVKGLNTQFKELSNFGDEISEKISFATKWLTSSKSDGTEKTIEERANKENALGDIIKGVVMSDETDQDQKGLKKKVILGGALSKMTSLNMTGRMDYSLPLGVFDVSLVSAISAHISYFEDENTAGFILKELLANRSTPVEETTVTSK